MPTIREKRVYVDQAETVAAYVAAALGVAVARVSGDKVGEFSLVERCVARDVATTAAGVAAATDEDVLLGDGEAFTGTGFGPAVAVASHGDGVLAAGEDGRVARFDGGDWTTVGDLDAEVRALEGALVAAADGVHRVTDDGIDAAGLDDVRDVAAAGVPLAATPDGLYRHHEPGDAGRERSASERTGDRDTAGAERAAWRSRDLPVDAPVAGVAYATDATLVLTADGALAVDAGDGFRHRSLGLRDARALAVVAEGNA